MGSVIIYRVSSLMRPRAPCPTPKHASSHQSPGQHFSCQEHLQIQTCMDAGTQLFATHPSVSPHKSDFWSWLTLCYHPRPDIIWTHPGIQLLHTIITQLPQGLLTLARVSTKAPNLALLTKLLCYANGATFLVPHHSVLLIFVILQGHTKQPKCKSIAPCTELALASDV